jgi:hypothetical protein
MTTRYNAKLLGQNLRKREVSQYTKTGEKLLINNSGPTMPISLQACQMQNTWFLKLSQSCALEHEITFKCEELKRIGRDRNLFQSGKVPSASVFDTIGRAYCSNGIQRVLAAAIFTGPRDVIDSPFVLAFTLSSTSCRFKSPTSLLYLQRTGTYKCLCTQPLFLLFPKVYRHLVVVQLSVSIIQSYKLSI